MDFRDKFKQSIYEPWRIQYVNYEKISSNSIKWTQTQLESYLHLELEKVERFINKKQREIEHRTSYCKRSNQAKSAELIDILLDLNELTRYTRLNFLAFQKLTCGTFVDKRLKSLDTQRFDHALVNISVLLDKLDGAQKPPTSAKFWIHPDYLTEVEAALRFHLTISRSDTITSVYFDTPSLDLYQAYLQRDEDAGIIRCRWYNEDREVRIERKFHRADCTNGESVTEGIYLHFDQISSFLQGNFIASQCKNSSKEKNKFFWEDIKTYNTALALQQTLSGLVPTMRIVHQRTLFQADLSILLDTNLTFLPIDGSPWCQETSDRQPYVFPYAVLEVNSHLLPSWLRQLVEPRWTIEVPRFSKYIQGISHFWKNELVLIPWWLKQSMTSETKKIGYLEHQFKHRTLLMRSSTNQNQQDDNDCCHSQQQLSYIVSRTASDKKHLDSEFTTSLIGDEKLPRFLAQTEKPLGEKKRKNEARIEPKVFFANERTFIHWLHFASMILNVAITLLNFGDGINRTVGIVFFGISFVFATYSFGFYRWRAHRISTKPHLRFDDVFGPVFLCILVTGALVVGFICEMLLYF